MKKIIPIPSLYAISLAQENTAILIKQIEAALKGGVRLLQYRDKSANPALRLEQAQALRALCTAYDALLFINDDVMLAKACQADGVHLGQSDESILQAKSLLGEQALVGVTCHDSLDLAAKAAGQGADYLSFGCFFPSTTKPLAKPASLAVLTQAKARFQQPIVAIGGITQDNAVQVAIAGADILAIGAGIFAGVDIEQNIRALQMSFKKRS